MHIPPGVSVHHGDGRVWSFFIICNLHIFFFFYLIFWQIFSLVQINLMSDYNYPALFLLRPHFLFSTDFLPTGHLDRTTAQKSGLKNYPPFGAEFVGYWHLIFLFLDLDDKHIVCFMLSYKDMRWFQWCSPFWLKPSKTKSFRLCSFLAFLIFVHLSNS